MEVLLRKLFFQHKVEVKQTIESTIASQIQQFSNAITQEQIERVQAIFDIQTQIADLRTAFYVFNINQTPMQRREDRGDEVAICGFGQKSKNGVMEFVQQIIHCKPGDLFIIKERSSQTLQFVPRKFSLRDHAEGFFRDHVRKK